MMQKKYIPILFSLIIAFSSFLLYPLLLSEFPDNGEVNREIWFIKPTTNETPYFILTDDIFTGNNMDVEWIQHGKDNLTLDPSTQEWNFTTTDYFEGKKVKLFGKIITNGFQFEEKLGFASAAENNEAPYLVANSKGPQQICTLLIPLNESISLPEINILESKKNETCISIQHDKTHDIFWSRFHDQKKELSKEVDQWIPKALSFFLRTNESNNLLSMAFRNASNLQRGDITHFTSSNPISGSLSFTETGLDGTLSIKKASKVEIRIPQPDTILINGESIESSNYDYRDGKVILDFNAPGNYSLGSQYQNFGQMKVNDYTLPSGKEVIEEIEAKKHPYLVYDNSDISNILDNLNLESPTKEFYQDLQADTSEFEKLIFLDGEISFDGIERGPFKHALICWSLQTLEGDEDGIEKIKKVLEKIPEYLYYSGKTLETAQVAYGAAIAYDSIYNNLTSSEQKEYAANLKQFVNPIRDAHDVIPLNNHLSTDLGALGLVGLVTKDADLTQIAINEIENFLDAETVDGIPIESFSIASIGHHLAAPYFYAMSRLGLIDYYQRDSVIDNYYDRAIDIMSPMGLFPHYEDAFDDWRPAIELRQVSHLTDNEDLRKKIAYIYDLQNQSSTYNLAGKYFFMELFHWKDLPSPQIPSANRSSWLSYKGGNAALRTNWNKNAVFISMNAKTYHQSHTQLDELSYEIYAYGALLSMNSGFPGWKKEGHSECVSTVGSNSIRLNNQDQLRETCDGFSFHAFSKETDIISMESGDLYSSPYAITQNPIFFVIIALLQILFLAIAVFYFLSIRKQRKTESEQRIKDAESLIDSKGVTDSNFLIDLTNPFFTIIDDQTIYQWKIFQTFVLLYFGLHFRLYAFSHSILRKLTEWSYTRDYELISMITNIVWVVLFVLPLLVTFILYLIFRRIHNRIIRSPHSRGTDIYSELKNRMKSIFIFTAIFIFILSILIYLREYRLMDLISKRFGTVSGFAIDFTSWALFQVGVMGICFAFVIGLFIYKYYQINIQQTKKYTMRLLIASLLIILIWTIFAILAHGLINSMSIETWVA